MIQLIRKIGRVFHKNISHYFDYYVLIIALIGNGMYYAQALEIFLSKTSCSVSLLGFLMGTFSSANWLIYGIVRKVKPIVISSTFGLVGGILVLGMIIFYRS